MKEFFWRLIYAAVCFVLFWWLFPLFLNVLDVNPSSSLIALMKGCSAGIAILYVLFGTNYNPPMPF